MKQVLVFVATRIGANRLAYQLNREGVHATAIHGDRTQAERMQALEDFKAGKVGVLVATDVAARGLDIEELPHVVNFELPNSPDDYVHRIGRTGRAGTRRHRDLAGVPGRAGAARRDREDDPHPHPARDGDRASAAPLGGAADGAAAPGAPPRRRSRSPHAVPLTASSREAARRRRERRGGRSPRTAPTRSSPDRTSRARRPSAQPSREARPGRRSASVRSPRCSAASVRKSPR